MSSQAEITPEGVGAGTVRVVDTRSDTLTQPSPGMLQAMVKAPLGDDVYGEDPTVKALEERVAKLLGKEAAVFVPTGTMANLIAVMSHCEKRGSEVLLGDQCHIHRWEQGGISQLGGVHPKTLRTLPDGTFSLEELRASVRVEDVHYPTTTLVCVENTHNKTGGKALPLSWLDELGATCRDLNLPLHMDGARLLNASVAQGEPPARLVQHCASVSLCLSKGLGAPVGSVLAGSKDFIYRAVRLRKALGGGMRQVGVLAGAGLYGLDHVYPRLHQDHQHIQIIAKAVDECGSKAVTCDPGGAHTNILVLYCNPHILTPEDFSQRMAQVPSGEVAALGASVVGKMNPIDSLNVRITTHLNISTEDITALVAKLVYVIKEIDAQGVKRA